jgi:protein-L-isoaspartate(D-aspartate) O-methyltransferase
MRRTGVILSLALALFTACSTAVTTQPPLTTEPATIASAPTLTPTPPTTEDEAHWAQQRELMVIETIERRGITDEDVLNAMRQVPRHLFVPENQRRFAYEDYPLPIGYGQTISQPYIVALMTELLELHEGDKVLEIGTGSGYQAAILAEIPSIEVYTIEIVPELATSACEQLESQGYANVHCKEGDGYYGWPEHSPFDAIIVTAAPDHLPSPLLEQLAYSGRMVIPIGPPGGYQTLWKFIKGPQGELQALNKGGVAFVPFTGPGMDEHGGEGGHEWPLP